MPSSCARSSANGFASFARTTHCYMSTGPELLAVAAALRGAEENVAFQQKLLDRYVGAYVEVLAPFVKLAKEELRLRCVALVGAGEALAREMLGGRITQARASKALATAMRAVLGSGA